ncbi:hypothetical protein ACIBBD_34730 [Streptomyces sp. NPDC051315]|uniref:hypothetical protein n=1 Tax=Streptomyces sp. NPDC051315 TaxID=3365650 RepID=UPI0037BC7CD0
MSRKRQRTPTLAETVASLPPVQSSEGEDAQGVLSPAGREEFVDDTGQRWQKVRGPLHPRLAQRLVVQADELIIGEGGGGQFRHVPPEDRLETWHAIKHRLDADGTPGYRPFAFSSAEGRTLLYIEEDC